MLKSRNYPGPLNTHMDPENHWLVAAKVFHRSILWFLVSLRPKDEGDQTDDVAPAAALFGVAEALSALDRKVVNISTSGQEDGGTAFFGHQEEVTK